MTERHILLVEDDPVEAALAVRALRQNKILNEVVVARDGQEALDHLFGNGGGAGDRLPELVLLDLKLPKVDGLEVLRRIRADARTHRLPVVVLTLSAADDDVIRSYEGGANSYVRKPVDYLQFTDAVRQLGLYWLVINRPPPNPEGP